MPKKAAPSAPSPAPEPSEATGVPIVVRRTIMKDEAAKTTTDPAAAADSGNPLDTKSKKLRIEPLPVPADAATAESTAPLTPPQPAEAVESPKPVESVPPAADPATPAPASAASVPPSEPKTTSEGGEFTLAGEDSVATPEDPSQNPIDQAKAAADKEAAEKQAALDKLVANQTYFLPLNRVEKRRSKQLLMLTLLLLVVLAGAAAFWANGQGLISVPGL